MKELPDKPSELIRLALGDLEKVEDSPMYEVDMNLWHTGLNGKFGICHVCLAGAVIASSLQHHNEDWVTPAHFNIPDKRKLIVIDHLRRGKLLEAATELNGISIKEKDSFIDAIEQNLLPENIVITYYEINKKFFKRDMNNLAFSLELLGL